MGSLFLSDFLERERKMASFVSLQTWFQLTSIFMFLKYIYIHCGYLFIEGSNEKKKEKGLSRCLFATRFSQIQWNFSHLFSLRLCFI